MVKHKIVSLFSGAGGLDIGFHQYGGFEVKFANDIRSAPATTYCHNFKCRTIAGEDLTAKTSLAKPAYAVGDITHLNFDGFLKVDADLVVGGPPCQDFSIVRGPEIERQGISTKRGNLYSHFIRALIHAQPKMFVFENVPGLVSANQGAAYQTILGDFTKLKQRWNEISQGVENGYSGEIENYTVIFSKVIDPANVGVPQRRRRLIIIGVRNDLAGDFLKVNDHKAYAEQVLSGKCTLFPKYPLTSMEVFYGKAIDELGSEYEACMKNYAAVGSEGGFPKALEWMDKVYSKLTFDSVKDYLAMNKLAGKQPDIKEAMDQHREVLKLCGYAGKNVSNLDLSDGTTSIEIERQSVMDRMSMIPPDENHDFVEGTEWRVSGKGMSLIYRRLHPLKPSYTVVAYGGGGTSGYHYERARGRLTNRERARLQTFPDWYEFKGNRADIRAQIGEAIPSLLGYRLADIAAHILNDK